jgi:hypothetical protein
MPFAACRSCRKLVQSDAIEQDVLCADCGRNVHPLDVLSGPLAPPSVPAPAATAHQVQADAATQSAPRDRSVFSPWLIGALLLFITAIAVIAINATTLKEGASWLTGVALLMMFGAMVIALAGVAASGDRDRQQRRLHNQNPYRQPLADRAALSHRWGWQVVRATGIFFGLCIMIWTGLSLLIGLPFWTYFWAALLLIVGGVAVGLFVYSVVVLPRISYFVAARFFGRGKPVVKPHAKRTTGAIHSAEAASTANPSDQSVINATLEVQEPERDNQQ